MRHFVFTWTLAATSLVSLPGLACPTCKGALHDNGVATGYAVSILFMLAMPITIGMFWALLIHRMRRTQQVIV